MMSEQQIKILSELNRQMTEEVIRLEGALERKEKAAVDRSKSIILQLQGKIAESMA